MLLKLKKGELNIITTSLLHTSTRFFYIQRFCRMYVDIHSHKHHLHRSKHRNKLKEHKR